MASTKTPSTTTKKPRSKTRRALKAAFVMTASLGAQACDGMVTTNPPPTNPPFIECPSSVPTEGADCEPPDETCTYPDECNLEIVASCTDGSWELEYTGTCNPPPPEECPVEPPNDLESCGEPMECQYQDECGQDFSASCDGANWSVSEPLESCNPPPPCPQAMPAEGSPCVEEFGTPQDCSWVAQTACGPAEVTGTCIPDQLDGVGYNWQLTAPSCTPEVPLCSQYDNAGLCDADTTCRWLVPGCSEEPKPEGFATGCYPIANCTADSCGEDAECTSVSYNPCWNELCDACGADASICLPTMGGG